MSNDERREVRAKVRSYKDKETGEDKNIYITVGTAWVSEHGSKISISLDSVPVSQDWDGKLYINKPYEAKDKNQQTHEFNKQVTKDNLPKDEDLDKPFDTSQIPF